LEWFRRKHIGEVCMAFSESIKEKVKRKAAFCCCRCHQLNVQVHHIIPESEGGSDEIENAAPLCANCHTWFGDNPKFRKEITQMRDWWYEQMEKQYPKEGTLSELNKIHAEVQAVRQGLSEIDELKEMLKEFAARAIDNITPTTATSAATSVASLTIPSLRISGTGHANWICGKCFAEAPYDSAICPNCGAEKQLDVA
jgi:hypothetical protein